LASPGGKVSVGVSSTRSTRRMTTTRSGSRCSSSKRS